MGYMRPRRTSFFDPAFIPWSGVSYYRLCHKWYQSFNAISAWIKQLKNNSNPDVKLFLVGNKNDLKEERKISFEEGKKYSKDFEFFLFCETSAKTGINCQEIFLCAAIVSKF